MDRLTLEEIHRFENGPAAGRPLYWDLLPVAPRAGRSAAAQANHGDRIESVGVDTWGVDFGCSGAATNCWATRSIIAIRAPTACSSGPSKSCRAKKSSPQTGLQFMQINTLYQLLAMRLQSSPLLDVAESLLMMPDLFHWLLTGVKANELTNATTTQFFNPANKRWATELLEAIRSADANLGQRGAARHTARADFAEGGRNRRD